MFSGLRASSLAVMAISAALFNRRARTGWLGELDDIRGDALAAPEEEVDLAMNDLLAVYESEVSPLRSIEAPLPPAALPPIPAPALEPELDLPEPSAYAQPSPHPMYPGEMWHPHVIESAAPAPAPEILSGRADPEPTELVDVVDHDLGDGDLMEEFFAQAPAYVPIQGIPTNGPLITGPVHRRGYEPLPEPVGETGGTSVSNEPATQVAWRWDQEDTHLDLTPQTPESPCRVLAVAPDGTVEVGDGIVRLSEVGSQVVEESSGGLAVDLEEGWCWADRTGAGPLTISVPVGTVVVPPDTVALSVIESDHSTFVVVIEGEALLEHLGGRLRLRAGAMAMASIGSEPRVDVATGPEILADDLVQLNLRLDGCAS